MLEPIEVTILVERGSIDHEYDSELNRGRDLTALICTKVECDRLDIKQDVERMVDELHWDDEWEAWL